MSIKLRIATFNLENLDDKPRQKPTLDERIALMRPQMLRLNADILCLQEVNGQEAEGRPRMLLALEKLLADTPYADYHHLSTLTGGGMEVYDQRNLVILSRFEITQYHEYSHDFALAPHYQKVTAKPPEPEAKAVNWERPILYARIKLDDTRTLNLINVHLKSRLPSDIPGQKENQYTWRTASAWAEGFFISSMKRVGQALEVRMLIDKLFDADENALIVVCGDFNADLDEVPVQAIRGGVEDTGNDELAKRVMVPCERSIPEPARFSLLHHGRGVMIDHLLISRSLLPHFRKAEIHNELLHDEC